MADAWTMMKNKLGSSKTVQYPRQASLAPDTVTQDYRAKPLRTVRLGLQYEIWDIESAEEDAKKSEFLQKHGIMLTSSGYPTIFMIIQGKQVDYNGERDVASLEQWATASVPT